ncbi:hypothetical protein T05_11484 [Trichinella murrelli]|uniref:Uncharacterized protein n=1 Tax=Trichinella murrelli TaxID=144512 RepID=A0A0V0TG58_9BILA|nr:hypothetical protein T05_11484 [Trichinella murrelli]
MKFNREETTEKFIHDCITQREIAFAVTEEVLCIFGKIFSRHSSILKSELVGVMKHYLIEPISSLTYVKGDLGYTSLNTITVEEEIELRFHSRFLIGVALMISYLILQVTLQEQSFLQLNILDNLIV